MPAQVACLIQPDYNATPAAVYTKTARAFIEAFGNLEPLREGDPGAQAVAPRGLPIGRGTVANGIVGCSNPCGAQSTYFLAKTSQRHSGHMQPVGHQLHSRSLSRMAYNFGVKASSLTPYLDCLVPKRTTLSGITIVSYSRKTGTARTVASKRPRMPSCVFLCPIEFDTAICPTSGSA